MNPVLPQLSCPSSLPARSGSQYYDVHRNTSLLLLRNLVSAGLVTCSAPDALALNLHRVFMPHGLGHLIGLDVHDPYVYPHRLQPPQPLQHGMVLTCEPGIYFVPSLIAGVLGNTQQAACVDRESLIRMQHTVGGTYFIVIIIVIIITTTTTTITTTVRHLRLVIDDGALHHSAHLRCTIMQRSECARAQAATMLLQVNAFEFNGEFVWRDDAAAAQDCEQRTRGGGDQCVGAVR